MENKQYAKPFRTLIPDRDAEKVQTVRDLGELVNAKLHGQSLQPPPSTYLRAVRACRNH
jgi:hypothetical protein